MFENFNWAAIGWSVTASVCVGTPLSIAFYEPWKKKYSDWVGPGFCNLLPWLRSEWQVSLSNLPVFRTRASDRKMQEGLVKKAVAVSQTDMIARSDALRREFAAKRTPVQTSAQIAGDKAMERILSYDPAATRLAESREILKKRVTLFADGCGNTFDGDRTLLTQLGHAFLSDAVIASDRDFFVKTATEQLERCARTDQANYAKSIPISTIKHSAWIAHTTQLDYSEQSRREMRLAVQEAAKKIGVDVYPASPGSMALALAVSAGAQ